MVVLEGLRVKSEEGKFDSEVARELVGLGATPLAKVITLLCLLNIRILHANISIQTTLIQSLWVR